MNVNPITLRCRAMRIAAMVSVALWLGLLSGCHPAGGKTAEKEGETTAPEVHVVHPQYQTIVREVHQPGYLRAYEQTPIFAKISGFAEEPKVDIGDPIKKDQVLLQLWVPEEVSKLQALTAGVTQAKADLRQADAAIEAAAATVEASSQNVEVAKQSKAAKEAERSRWEAEVVRANKLLGGNVYDTQTRDEAVNQFKASSAAVKEAEARVTAANATFLESVAKLNKAKADRDAAAARVGVADAVRQQQENWLGYATLKAPYDGVVTLRNVHTGHFLQATNSGSTSRTADPLFMVMRTDIFRVTVQVPEAYEELVKQAADREKNGVPTGEGSSAVVRIRALPGREFPGTVTRYAWALDESARTLRVEVHLKNTTGELRVNQYANVVIKTDLPNALVLPVAAVLTDGNQDYFFQVKDGKAVRTLVQTGIRNEQWVQVFTKQEPTPTGAFGPPIPFSMNEAIVVSNPGALLDGQTVRITE